MKTLLILLLFVNIAFAQTRKFFVPYDPHLRVSTITANSIGTHNLSTNLISGESITIDGKLTAGEVQTGKFKATNTESNNIVTTEMSTKLLIVSTMTGNSPILLKADLIADTTNIVLGSHSVPFSEINVLKIRGSSPFSCEGIVILPNYFLYLHDTDKKKWRITISTSGILTPILEQ